MKTKLFCLVSILICMSFIFLSTAEDAKAEITDLGRHCFELQDNTFSGVLFVIKLNVTSLNNNTFSLNGELLNQYGVLLSPVYGSAVLNGNKIIATLTGTSVVEGTPLIGTVAYHHIILDSSSLSGSHNLIGINISSSVTLPVEITASPFISISLPAIKRSCSDFGG